jgi:hypothetical protein
VRSLIAADSGDGEFVVSDRDTAIDELVVRGGELTKSLIGFRSRIDFGVRE